MPVPCDDPAAWGEWFCLADRWVAMTEIGCLVIGTAFIGVDRRHGVAAPELFETVIEDGGLVRHQMRCATWDQAMAQHAEAVRMAIERVRRADQAVMAGTRHAAG